MHVILVLCQDDDHSGMWATAALRARGLSPTLLLDTELGAVTRWSHRLGAWGAECEVWFEGGLRLHSRDVDGVLNRISFVPRAWDRRVAGPDRGYAMQEMHAFYLSWLTCLRGEKLNPATPQGLCGNLRHPSAWTSLAARAGVPVRRFRQGHGSDPAEAWAVAPPSSHVFVVRGRVVGPRDLVGVVGAACARLAELSSTPLLGVGFEVDGDGSARMTGVSVAPALSNGGDELADALAEALTR